MNASTDVPIPWHLEFAKIISCTRCSQATDPNLLRDGWENVPQPGYVGEGYGRTRLLLVGQNPGVPSSGLREKDRKYTAALRALRDVPTPQHYAVLQWNLSEFMPSWPVHGRHFPLEECGLSLTDIAYCNLVRCRTVENSNLVATLLNCAALRISIPGSKFFSPDVSSSSDFGPCRTAEWRVTKDVFLMWPSTEAEA